MTPPFWKKGPPVVDEPEPERPPVPDIPPGHKQCTRSDCPNANGNPCAYVDRRARRCETAWCPDHRTIIVNAVYCPRHAGIMTALLASSRKGHLPDIDNRAPSLANWIGNDLNEDVERMLNSIIGGEEETLVVDPVAYIYSSHDQTHRWERAWKIVDHTGVKLKVGVDVDESKDYVVRLRVGQRTVNQVVPPWVGRHEKREWVDPDTDRRERAAFYKEVSDQLNEAIMTAAAETQQRPYYGTRG